MKTFWNVQLRNHQQSELSRLSSDGFCEKFGYCKTATISFIFEDTNFRDFSVDCIGDFLALCKMKETDALVPPPAPFLATAPGSTMKVASWNVYRVAARFTEATAQ